MLSFARKALQKHLLRFQVILYSLWLKILYTSFVVKEFSAPDRDKRFCNR